MSVEEYRNTEVYVYYYRVDVILKTEVLHKNVLFCTLEYNKV